MYFIDFNEDPNPLPQQNHRQLYTTCDSFSYINYSYGSHT